MNIISHRGLWRKPEEKNTRKAFLDSLDAGFGIETDFRDALQTVVVSHDMPKGGEMTIDDFCSLFGVNNYPLALNIKADGLADILSNKLHQYNINEGFVFDMSIPDTIAHLKAGNRVFTRLSDVEPEPLFFHQSAGVWLDAFYSEWYNLEVIRNLLRQQKQVCIVSPELHKRKHEQLWNSLSALADADGLILCTDFPLEAKEFFN